MFDEPEGWMHHTYCCELPSSGMPWTEVIAYPVRGSTSKTEAFSHDGTIPYRVWRMRANVPLDWAEAEEGYTCRSTARLIQEN
ncbi:uncharacterized protein RHO25_006294 [Cercospora beticola]|uniref:Uncharacterized protein n=1 Tax=Cercospora beticola TaxID=122368 RepID=A0ABZ0NQ28_CERBT|nr:hypothetical protein RHO25_006294 [Cercospora beticola]CAK1363525.1 unnamed protein product [Cercospora beticola]